MFNPMCPLPNVAPTAWPSWLSISQKEYFVLRNRRSVVWCSSANTASGSQIIKMNKVTE